MMDQTYIERLRKLEAHLRQLDKSNFYFGAYITRWDKDNACGTVACAIGWCPTVFPEDWEVIEIIGMNMTLPALRVGSHDDEIKDAAIYFGLDLREADHLFTPCCQNVSTFGGRQAGSSATPTLVADNIKAFLAYKRENDNHGCG